MPGEIGLPKSTNQKLNAEAKSASFVDEAGVLVLASEDELALA